ncbi:sensor histidine kinase [Solicola gregarius]|uniref:histidine kinase n=1 Tax=Solicola gregarius TaxID=2908642 RepID=A0AA46TH20_9ACTN|nr:ATP-binding protein [Solicola gregarius]UYM05214.1 ATP-binding protein [Solicola gregarius]
MELDALPDGVLVAAADGVVSEVNTTLERLLGSSRSDLVGKHLADVLVLDDKQGNSWYACHRPYEGFANRTRIAEGSWYTPDGTELLVTATLERLRPRGAVQRVVMCIRNGRARAAKDRTRSDLVATVAHELRSPLTGVKGFTATLLRKWDRFSDDQRKLMLETIDNDANRLSRLITELLDAARIDSGRLTLRPRPIRLAETVQGVLDSISAGTGQPLAVDEEGDVATIWADPDRVAQLVTNVVENAMRHGRGAARISVRRPRDDRDGAVLVVEDDGPGIPPEMRSRIFTRFWKSGERGGSGLGLYIVRGIVEGHHGEVGIGDADGGGARVTVWLPVNQPEILDAQ